MSGPGPAGDDRERIRQATDIVDLIGGFLQLRRQGRNFVALCPWHDDHKPSLMINPARQSWKCWVCDLGGDVFSFVMKRDSVDFREALQILADRAGIQLAERGRKVAPGSPDDKQTLYECARWIVKQYHQHLLQSDQAASARAYLESRNITPQSIEKFQIGFAPDQRDWLGQRARGTPYSNEILSAVGVLAESSSGMPYERFRGRIMFPIFDLQQRAVGMGGRVLPEVAQRAISDGQREPAKYINSPETRIFSKSDQLYGLNLVRDAANRPQDLVVVEGYTDVVAAWQAGLENVVAVLGTALNQRHLRLMKRFVDRVILVLDGDEAGRRRANETLDLFLEAELDLRVLTLTGNSDPHDFLQHHSANDFRKLLVQAADALDHKLRCELEGIDVRQDTHRASQALENVLQTIARRPSATLAGAQILREQQMLARLSTEFLVELDQLRSRVQELRGRKRVATISAPADSASVSRRLDTKERELLEILSFDHELAALAIEQLSPNQLISDAARAIYEAICARHFNGLAVDFSSVMTHLEDPQLKSLWVELDDTAQAKYQRKEIDVSGCLAGVIRAFERASLEADNRQAIAQLQKTSDVQEETSALLEILERARRRQNFSSPSDG